MPPKRGNQKPKGAGKPNRKNRPTNWNPPGSTAKMRSRDIVVVREPRPRYRQSTTMKSQGAMRGSVGNAALIRQPRIGMPDLMSHVVSWVCGGVYIGNNTLGANDGVYFVDSTKTYTNPYPTAVLGADALIGASYVVSIEKLYRRKRYRRVRIQFLAVQSSTTNNMTLTVAPVRGPPGFGETGSGQAGTVAPITQAAAMSLTGAKTVDSFEDANLDLTPFIAGGSGALQNEFAIASSVNAASILVTPANLLGVSPAAFVVAGNSTVTALRGTLTHQVVIETVVDYLDFVGGVQPPNPEGLAPWPAPRTEVTQMSETRDEKRARLLSELSAVAREDSAERHRSPGKGKSETNSL